MNLAQHLDAIAKNNNQAIADNHQQWRKKADRVCTFILLLWLCGGLLYVLPNHGGSGLELPQNILAWCAIALLAMGCLCCIIHRRSGFTYSLPPGSLLIIIGGVLWSLPLLWSPKHDWMWNALPRVMALWGLIGLYVLLLIATSCRAGRQRMLLIVVLAAVVQMGDAAWQIIHTTQSGRPWGSFQQVNVLASFLASGVVAAMWLYLFSPRCGIRVIAGIAMALGSLCIVVLQSRAGYLGALLAVAVLSYHAKANNRLLTTLVILAVGTLLGYWLVANNIAFIPALVDKEGSTRARMRMLKTTWQLIAHHPVSGNGYGSFEVLFGQQIADDYQPGDIGMEVVTHPHNELLLAWCEGGVCALAGLILMIAGVFQRLWGRKGMRLAGMALLLPIATHMNLEYPLYLSASHGLLLVLLLSLCGPGSPAKEQWQYRSPELKFISLWGGVILSLGLLVFMLTGLVTQQRLNDIENRGFYPFVMNDAVAAESLINPLIVSDRIAFDRHMALLLRFNMTHSMPLLARFERWGRAYLQTHNDPAVYASLIAIDRMTYAPDRARICQQAHRRWPGDVRFNCTGL